MNLLPCPFCNSDKVQITLYNHPTIVCQNCWAMGPKATRLIEPQDGLTNLEDKDVQSASKEAHELWNKRASKMLTCEEALKLPTTERCEVCKFWSRHSHITNKGWCKRFPPVVVPVTEWDNVETSDSWTTQSEHPETTDIEWCGEWRPRLLGDS